MPARRSPGAQWCGPRHWDGTNFSHISGYEEIVNRLQTVCVVNVIASVRPNGEHKPVEPCVPRDRDSSRHISLVWTQLLVCGHNEMKCVVITRLLSCYELAPHDARCKFFNQAQISFSLISSFLLIERSELNSIFSVEHWIARYISSSIGLFLLWRIEFDVHYTSYNGTVTKLVAQQWAANASARRPIRRRRENEKNTLIQIRKIKLQNSLASFEFGERRPETRNWTMFARIRLTCLKYCRCFDERAKCFLLRAAEEKMIIITFKCYKSLLRRNDAFLGDRFFSRRLLLFLFHCESVNSQIQTYIKFKWTH